MSDSFYILDISRPRIRISPFLVCLYLVFWFLRTNLRDAFDGTLDGNVGNDDYFQLYLRHRKQTKK